MDPEALPYRSPVTVAAANAPITPTRDEDEYGTLKSVYIDMKAAIERLDQWHAFNLDEKTAGLTLKQQIVAHKQAYDIVAPLFSTLESAVELIDRTFIERQKGNR